MLVGNPHLQDFYRSFTGVLQDSYRILVGCLWVCIGVLQDHVGGLPQK